MDKFPASLFLIASVVLVAPGCDRGDTDRSAEATAQEVQLPAHHDHTDIEEPVDLKAVDDDRITQLEVSGAERYDACREMLEQQGEPTDFTEGFEQLERTLFGCNAESLVELDGGGWLAAWEVPMAGHKRLTDLRVVRYREDGTVAWHRRMDRSWRADEFAASYRGSFLTTVGEELACAGTRWLEQTQAMCLRLDTGRVAWEGRMGFRAGTGLFGYDNSLFGTDDDGITRRYPYSGVEMRHRAFAEPGGPTSVHAHDGRHVFFVPGENHPIVEAWDVDTLQRLWSAELPEMPNQHRRHFDAAVADHQLLILWFDKRLVGLDIDTGRVRMALAIGDHPPSITYSDDELYLLARTDDRPLIYGLHPEDGSLRWTGDAPPGVREITWSDHQQALLARTVRTVRNVEPPG